MYYRETKIAGITYYKSSPQGDWIKLDYSTDQPERTTDEVIQDNSVQPEPTTKEKLIFPHTYTEPITNEKY